MTSTKQLQTSSPKSRQAFVYLIFSAQLLLTGCASDPAVKIEKPFRKSLAPMGYTVQVGAFSKMSNAVRLTEKLQKHGLNAYHFLHSSGLYKVRFGNYTSKNHARQRVENLTVKGIIDEYYIIGPDEYTAIKDRRYGTSGIRNHIVKTAKRYIGVPYRWGGKSPKIGFDCSGFTMVVYQLNGLNLPRSSKQQWKVGRPIKRRQLLKGDLVFFATSGGKRVSHVGIYMGDSKFLHAPGRDRKIRSSSLSDIYFKTRYVGARTYL